MEKSAFSPEGEHLRKKLVAMREKAGMTQRELAKKLRREHSFVSRTELGERRLDFVEFFWVVGALGEDAATVAADLMREFGRLDPQKKAAKRRGRAQSRS